LRARGGHRSWLHHVVNSLSENPRQHLGSPSFQLHHRGIKHPMKSNRGEVRRGYVNVLYRAEAGIDDSGKVVLCLPGGTSCLPRIDREGVLPGDFVDHSFFPSAYPNRFMGRVLLDILSLTFATFRCWRFSIALSVLGGVGIVSFGFKELTNRLTARDSTYSPCLMLIFGFIQFASSCKNCGMGGWDGPFGVKWV